MKIYKCVKKSKLGYTGYIKIFDDNKYQYCQSSKIVRLNKIDAKWDSINLYLDYCILNNNGITI
jgi:hypothetical protein